MTKRAYSFTMQLQIMSNKTTLVQLDALKTDRIVIGGTGLRVTKQRSLLLEVIRQGKSHLDADEVYRRARRKQPQLSLSTVYRALRLFKKLGLVEETHLDDEHHHYEVKSETEHHHLVCLKCGKVVEFSYPFSRNVRENVAEAQDFEIIGTEVLITGYCSKCKER